MSSAGNTCSKGYILFIKALLLLIMTQPNLLELAKQGNANGCIPILQKYQDAIARVNFQE
jgi:hypothetical protein